MQSDPCWVFSKYLTLILGIYRLCSVCLSGTLPSDPAADRYFLLYLSAAFLRGGCLSGRGRGADPLFFACFFIPACFIISPDRIVRHCDISEEILSAVNRGEVAGSTGLRRAWRKSGAGHTRGAFGRSVYSDGYAVRVMPQFTQNAALFPQSLR